MTPQTHLHRWGDGKGPPVILLHGWTMTGDVWAPVAERLGTDCLAPDLPEHGDTRGYEPSVPGAVAQLSDLIAQQGLTDATLVGWSLGALVGWSYLARGGKGVARMVSLDMSPRPLPAPDWDYPMRNQTELRAAKGARRFRNDWNGAAKAIAQAMFARPEGCAGMKASEAEARIRHRDPEAMARFWESLTGMDLRDAVRSLRLPLLALHGAESRVYRPETGAWIAANAAEAEVRVLEHCGHAPNLEDPDGTAAAIANFARLP